MFLVDVGGYIEENDGSKYLVLASTVKNKEALKNYTKLWEETKRQIEVIYDDEPIKYRKDFKKIRFESDNDLPLSKTLNIVDMIMVVKSALEKKANIIHKFFYMNARMTYKNVAIWKNWCFRRNWH